MTQDSERLQEAQEERYLDMTSHASELIAEGAIEEAVSELILVPDEPEGAAWLHEKAMVLLQAALATAPASRERVDEIVTMARSAMGQASASSECERADCHLWLGKCELSLGRDEEALREWESAAVIARDCQTMNPDCLKIVAKAARECAKAGDTVRAVAIADSIVFDELRESTLRQIRSGDLSSDRLWDPVPACLAALRSNDPEERRQAAHGAGSLGLSRNHDVRQALKRALEDPVQAVREAALTALQDENAK